MSFVYGNKSKQRLSECAEPLQILMNKVLEETEHDITILCGSRSKEEQDAAYAAGNSKLKYPRSKHNQTPSLAVDVAPYPIDWKDIAAFKELGALVKRTWDSMSQAEKEGYTLSWGGDWKSFKDMPHYELRK
jgi:peptidoglycan LD-endopeptidase CwlK